MLASPCLFFFPSSSSSNEKKKPMFQLLSKLPWQAPSRAISANALSALMCPVGVAITLLLDVDKYGDQQTSKLVEGFTAGGFLYISLACAMKDLIDNVESVSEKRLCRWREQ